MSQIVYPALFRDTLGDSATGMAVVTAIPPLGAAFLVGSTTEVDKWLGRPPTTVGIAGISTAQGARAQSLPPRARAGLRRASASDAVARLSCPTACLCRKRTVHQATSEPAEPFCPDLLQGRRYDLASIVDPSPQADLPPLPIRMTGLPTFLPTDQIESWVHRLERVAATAGGSLTGTRGLPQALA